MTRALIIVAALSLAVLIGGLTLFSMQGEDDQFAQCRQGVIAGGSDKIGGPFELVSETGETVTDKDVIDEPAILYFGYTFCPDVCPLDTVRNAQAVEILEERGYRVKPVFISVDPERDTPQVVNDFTANIHPRMLGLTGSPEQVKAASQAYRTYYNAHDDGSEYYLVDHSTMSYLALPGIGYVDFFRRDVGPEAMADRVQCFIDNM
jgi:protein SCO1/2